MTYGAASYGSFPNEELSGAPAAPVTGTADAAESTDTVADAGPPQQWFPEPVRSSMAKTFSRANAYEVGDAKAAKAG